VVSIILILTRIVSIQASFIPILTRIGSMQASFVLILTRIVSMQASFVLILGYEQIAEVINGSIQYGFCLIIKEFIQFSIDSAPFPIRLVPFPVG